MRTRPQNPSCPCSLECSVISLPMGSTHVVSSSPLSSSLHRQSSNRLRTTQPFFRLENKRRKVGQLRASLFTGPLRREEANSARGDRAPHGTLSLQRETLLDCQVFLKHSRCTVTLTGTPSPKQRAHSAPYPGFGHRQRAEQHQNHERLAYTLGF